MPTEGYTSKLAISATTTFAIQYEFLNSSLKMTTAPMISEGLRGTRSRISERTRYGNKAVGGSISMQPTPTELSTLLPWILGGNASGTTYPLAETLPERYVALETDPSIKWQRFSGCKVARATFAASEGNPLSLSLDLLGKDEEMQTAGTFASLTPDNDSPFMFYDSSGGFEYAGDVYAIKSFQLVIDNALEAKFYNSRTATSILPRDRVVSLSLTAELTSSNRTTMVEGAETATMAEIIFTKGTQSLVFTMNALRGIIDTPTISGRSETMINFSGQACRAGTDLELITVLDHTA